MTTTQEDKLAALASFLSLDTDDVTESTYDPNTFDVGSGEYLVLSDDEATDYATDYIRESVWAFNASFLQSYLAGGKLSAHQIDTMRGDMCEDINDAFLAMIDDFESFADDAIDYDGRGHFISCYDGEEIESNGFFIYRTN